MIDGLRRRVAALEAKSRQGGGTYVAPIYPGETEEEARQLAGVPDDAEMVILIRRFATSRTDDAAKVG
jgi:hypothetical protein